MAYIQALQILSTRYKKILQMEQSSQNALVEDYRTRLPALATQFRNIKVPEPVLTIPRIFGRAHDENFISDYLAYILDPGKTGLGTAPLEAFLRLCQIDFMNVPLNHTHITREYRLEGGRIDLLIECEESLVVGVENKIFSGEGKGQTANYSRVLDKDFAEISHSLVFLTREGYSASSKNAILISYTDLWKALRNAPVPVSQDQRKMVLWKDFLEHLEVYIMNTNSNADRFEFSEKTQLYFDNYEMITDLTETYKQEWGDAIAFLETSLKSRLGEGWETYFPAKYGYHQALKIDWGSSPTLIHFEWFFDFQKYREGQLVMAVDVEGKKVEEALTLFDVYHKKMEKTYTRFGIDYRPKIRKNAVAFKKYSIEQDFNKVAEKFIESFEEFRFLEPVIDEVVATLSKKA